MERLDRAIILSAGPGDAEGIARVHVKAWRLTYRGLLPERYLAAMSTAQHAARWRRRLLAPDPGEVVLAAEAREGLVGYCSAQVRQDQRSAEIFTLYLLPEAQGRGLGRRLLSSTARALHAAGAETLQLWVLNGNDRARRFYEHLGASVAGERPVRGWGGGCIETAMAWTDLAVLIRAG